MKTCSLCNESKMKSEFGPAKRYAEGLYCWCRTCVNAYRKEKYYADPEKFRKIAREYSKNNRVSCAAARKKWSKANPESDKASDRRKYAKNSEKIKARVSAWGKENPELRKQYCRKWDAKNPDKKRAQVRKRQVSKLQATPSWANHFFIGEAYDLAERRTKLLGIKYSVDHIVPIKSKLVCGLHVENNLQVIPLKENMSKNNRHWPDMPVGI